MNKIHYILWNQKVNHRFLKTPPILSQINPVRATPYHFLMVRFIIIYFMKYAISERDTWCVQVLRSPKEAFAAAMQSWRERCEKCVCLQGDYVEK